MMNAFYIGDNIAFGENIVSAALHDKGYINLVDCIDTSRFNLGTGGKTLDLMETENILWEISNKINELKSNGVEQVDCLIIQAETTFKDNDSLSDSLGLDLVKHILLTEYPDLRGMKIIALSFFDLHDLVRRNPDNVILLSPYVDLAHRIVNPEALGNQLSRIVAAYNREMRAEGEDYYRNLNNYVVILPEEETEANHHRRNLTGIDSLYDELYMGGEKYRESFTEDVLKSIDYADDTWKLYHKKMVFKSKVKVSVNRKEPFSEAEKDAYERIFKAKFPGKELTQPDEWPTMFGDVIEKITENTGKALAIEDKSYWVNFYKRILCSDKDIKSYSKFEEARDFIQSYANGINSIYENVIDQFRAKIIRQEEFDCKVEDLGFPDIYIVDIYLNPADEKEEITRGMQLISQIKEVNRLVPVVVCSASKNNERIRKAIKAGADELFIKDAGGGLRYLILKLYQWSCKASLYKNAGELIHLLEDENTHIPRLVSDDDGSWHLYKQGKVLTIRDMRMDERLLLASKIEGAIAEGQGQVWKTVYKGFTDKPSSAAPDYDGTFFLNQMLKEMAEDFKNCTDKKRIVFGGDNMIFDDTEQLLKLCKPVRVKVTGKTAEQIYVHIEHTGYNGYIEKTQMKRLGYFEADFNAVGENYEMIACRRKYYGMPDELVSDTDILMDLIKIDANDKK